MTDSSQVSVPGPRHRTPRTESPYTRCVLPSHLAHRLVDISDWPEAALSIVVPSESALHPCCRLGRRKALHVPFMRAVKPVLMAAHHLLVSTVRCKQINADATNSSVCVCQCSNTQRSPAASYYRSYYPLNQLAIRRSASTRSAGPHWLVPEYWYRRRSESGFG